MKNRGPVEQVIPARRDGVADVLRGSASIAWGPSSRTVTYVISQPIHDYTPSTCLGRGARALELNAAERVFRFAPDNWDGYGARGGGGEQPGKRRRSIRVVRPGGSAFAVEPTTGEVKGGGIQPVRGHHVDAQGGARRERVDARRWRRRRSTSALPCEGPRTTRDWCSRKRRRGLRRHPRGSWRTRTATLRNPTEHGAVFTVDERHERISRRSDRARRFRATGDWSNPSDRGRVDLDVTLHNPTPGKHDLPMRVYVRGEPGDAPCLADAVEPEVTVKIPVLEPSSSDWCTQATRDPAKRSDGVRELAGDAREHLGVRHRRGADRRPRPVLRTSTWRIPEAWSPHEDEELEKIVGEPDPRTLAGTCTRFTSRLKQELTFHMVFHPTDAAGAESFVRDADSSWRASCASPTPAEHCARRSPRRRKSLGSAGDGWLTSRRRSSPRGLSQGALRASSSPSRTTIRRTGEPALGSGKPVALDADEESVIDDGREPYDLVHTFDV